MNMSTLYFVMPQKISCLRVNIPAPYVVRTKSENGIITDIAVNYEQEEFALSESKLQYRDDKGEYVFFKNYSNVRLEAEMDSNEEVYVITMCPIVKNKAMIVGSATIMPYYEYYYALSIDDYENMQIASSDPFILSPCDTEIENIISDCSF